MAQSDAPTVARYIGGCSSEHAPALRRLRTLATRTLHGHEERMHWGMPAYLRENRVSFGFAVQSRYLSLYFRSPGLLDRSDAGLQRVKRGKGCLRFRRPEEIDWPLVERLLVETSNSAPPPA